MYEDTSETTTSREIIDDTVIKTTTVITSITYVPIAERISALLNRKDDLEKSWQVSEDQKSSIETEETNIDNELSDLGYTE